MSDEDRESEETNEDVLEDELELDDELDESEGDDEVSGNTNDAINANLNKIDDLDVLKGMVTRLRHENGNHRRGKNELAKENEKLKSWKNSNLKRAAEAEARADKAEKIAKQHIIKAAAAEYDVDEEFIDFIDGSTDEEIYEKASKLANTKKRRPKSYDQSAAENPMFGGRRGNPLMAPKQAAGDDFLRELMGGGEPRRRR